MHKAKQGETKVLNPVQYQAVRTGFDENRYLGVKIPSWLKYRWIPAIAENPANLGRDRGTDDSDRY